MEQNNNNHTILHQDRRSNTRYSTKPNRHEDTPRNAIPAFGWTSFSLRCLTAIDLAVGVLSHLKMSGDILNVQVVAKYTILKILEHITRRAGEAVSRVTGRISLADGREWKDAMVCPAGYRNNRGTHGSSGEKWVQLRFPGYWVQIAIYTISAYRIGGVITRIVRSTISRVYVSRYSRSSRPHSWPIFKALENSLANIRSLAVGPVKEVTASKIDSITDKINNSMTTKKK
ncbi:hypothetical protein B9Z19DRAFT_1196579 [Tuber borchii]|uniref:Uncharacterized protein n=1 Tax=Tuber borchii TaxID=42251 RepID=A0A2T6ZEL2_TUBBO|nr:hypothetical protein B9Z19DRAFT_1196579 [Tuber borchii]